MLRCLLYKVEKKKQKNKQNHLQQNPWMTMGQTEHHMCFLNVFILNKWLNNKKSFIFFNRLFPTETVCDIRFNAYQLFWL